MSRNNKETELKKKEVPQGENLFENVSMRSQKMPSDKRLSYSNQIRYL